MPNTPVEPSDSLLRAATVVELLLRISLDHKPSTSHNPQARTARLTHTLAWWLLHHAFGGRFCEIASITQGTHDRNHITAILSHLGPNVPVSFRYLLLLITTAQEYHEHRRTPASFPSALLHHALREFAALIPLTHPQHATARTVASDPSLNGVHAH